MSHLIGLDVGTTRVKAVGFDLHGTVVSAAELPTPWQRGPDGVEMFATQLAAVVRAVVTQASSPLKRVAGIGVTGMGEAGVLTAAPDAPAGGAADPDQALAPIRAWHDGRGDLEAIRRTVGTETFQRATGMPLTPQPSLPKILQLRLDYPKTLAAQRFWSVPEWAVLLLGGWPGSELSLASRTGLLDVLAGRPWSGAVGLLGADLLGQPQPAGTPCGHARALDGAPQLSGAVLVVGGHDHQCAALAAGAVHDGTLFDSLGTAEALLRFTGESLDPATIGELTAAGLTVGRTVVTGRLCVLAGLMTGMQLEQQATALGATDRERRRALAGRADWASAVERIVDGARPALAAIRAATGEHTAVLAAGGWLQDGQVLAAKRRQLPGLVLTSVIEAGAAGAAYLAGVAAGLLPPAEDLEGPPWADQAAEPAPAVPVRQETR
jgi:sugar (pentulose or hexulose) kinase